MKEIYNESFKGLDCDPRPIIWVKEFDFDNAEIFIRTLDEYETNDSVKEIYIYITSFGGEIPALFAMIDAMQNCKKPINTIAYGSAASCGAILFIMGTGTRYIGSNSRLHIHHLRADIVDDMVGIKQETKTLSAMNDSLFKMISNRSKHTVTEIKNMLKSENKEWSVTAKEAIKWNFADKIGTPKLKTSLIITCEE